MLNVGAVANSLHFTRYVQAHLRRHMQIHNRVENYNPRQRKLRNLVVKDDRAMTAPPPEQQEEPGIDQPVEGEVQPATDIRLETNIKPEMDDQTAEAKNTEQQADFSTIESVVGDT